MSSDPQIDQQIDDGRVNALIDDLLQAKSIIGDLQMKEIRLLREREGLLGLLATVFDEPGPACENAGNLQNPFSYFRQQDWDHLKARWKAIKGS